MLEDKKFMEEHVALLQRQVLDMRNLMERELDRMKIPYFKGIAGFFVWMDLRAYLKENSYEGEQELCKWLFEHGNIIVAPGAKYNSTQPGWFRWIFTCYEEKEMMAALQGLEKALKERSWFVWSNTSYFIGILGQRRPLTQVHSSYTLSILTVLLLAAAARDYDNKHYYYNNSTNNIIEHHIRSGGRRLGGRSRGLSGRSRRLSSGDRGLSGRGRRLSSGRLGGRRLSGRRKSSGRLSGRRLGGRRLSSGLGSGNASGRLNTWSRATSRVNIGQLHLLFIHNKRNRTRLKVKLYQSRIANTSFHVRKRIFSFSVSAIKRAKDNTSWKYLRYIIQLTRYQSFRTVILLTNKFCSL